MNILNCDLCPRNCKVNRSKEKGFCDSYSKIKIAKQMLHHWEEPCISGENGSGAVFFSGCNLKCIYCQNYEISKEGRGREVTVSELAEIFLNLQNKGAHNINLVTPTHYISEIIKALDKIKKDLYIPVVYNTGGYEKPETIRMLKDYIDIYIQDIKYSDDNLAFEYSRVKDYFETAKRATQEMIKNKGTLKFDENGMLKKGVIIRHLVLPGHRKNSYGVLEFIKELPSESYLISLMSQFTPTRLCEENNILNKKVSKKEYEFILNKAFEYGIENGYFQDLSSASEDYIPDFCG